MQYCVNDLRILALRLFGESDALNENIERLATAHHEVAHAAIGAYLGASFKSVSIGRNDGDWMGTSTADLGDGCEPIRRRKIVAIAVAGPLGQLKFRAQSRWGELLFNRADRLVGFMRGIRNAEAVELPRLYIGFSSPNGAKHNLEVLNFNDICDFFRLQGIARDINDAELFEIVDHVRELLDRTEVWNSVRRLADLLNRNSQVDGKEVIAILGTLATIEHPVQQAGR